jgi:hypothetical protein
MAPKKSVSRTKPAAKKSAAKKPAAKKPAAKKSAAKKSAAKKPSAKKQPIARKPAAGSAGTESPVSSVGRVKTAQEAFLFFLPQAEKIAKAEILPFRLDPVLALQNIQTGLKGLEPCLATLKKALPELPWAQILDLPALGQAVTFAATQVVNRPAELGELRAQLSEAATLRTLLLSTAGALVLADALPAPAVEKIRRGSGPIDLASDLVGLAALYRKHPAAMSAQKLVGVAQLDRAAELGTELLSRLKPKGARVSAAKSGQPDVVARDRLATLLWQRHGELRKAAYYQWGDDFERFVPALQSRRSTRKSIPPAPPAPSSKTPKPLTPATPEK